MLILTISSLENDYILFCKLQILILTCSQVSILNLIFRSEKLNSYLDFKKVIIMQYNKPFHFEIESVLIITEVEIKKTKSRKIQC